MRIGARSEIVGEDGDRPVLQPRGERAARNGGREVRQPGRAARPRAAGRTPLRCSAGGRRRTGGSATRRRGCSANRWARRVTASRGRAGSSSSARSSAPANAGEEVGTRLVGRHLLQREVLARREAGGAEVQQLLGRVREPFVEPDLLRELGVGRDQQPATGVDEVLQLVHHGGAVEARDVGLASGGCRSRRRWDRQRAGT